MKAKYFKKLRKNLKLQTFSIRETAGLFGDFFGHNRIGLIMSDTFVSATNPSQAIRIYMRNYLLNNKKKNEYYDSDTETTESWATLMVKDEKGNMYFYR